MQAGDRRQVPKSLRWWIESDWRVRSVILGSVLAAVAAMLYAWLSPMPRPGTFWVLGTLALVWSLDLVRGWLDSRSRRE
jgi:hypothetical protein